MMVEHKCKHRWRNTPDVTERIYCTKCGITCCGRKMMSEQYEMPPWNVKKSSNETKIVPVEPTEEMVMAVWTSLMCATEINISAVQCALRLGIKAAPSPDDPMKNNLASGVVPVRLAAPDDELARLEREIAERLSVAAIKKVYGAWWHGWFDTGVGAYTDVIRYLDLRGLLERHPTDPKLVRLREKDNDQ